jgi:hypothetical protein
MLVRFLFVWLADSGRMNVLARRLISSRHFTIVVVVDSGSHRRSLARILVVSVHWIAASES